MTFETEEQPGYAERDDEPTTDQSGAGNSDQLEEAAPDQGADSEDEQGS